MRECFNLNACEVYIVDQHVFNTHCTYLEYDRCTVYIDTGDCKYRPWWQKLANSQVLPAACYTPSAANSLVYQTTPTSPALDVLHHLQRGEREEWSGTQDYAAKGTPSSVLCVKYSSFHYSNSKSIQSSKQFRCKLFRRLPIDREHSCL